MRSSLRAFEQIQGYLVESARTLFDEYGLTITHIQDAAPMPTQSGQCIAGVLGYTAPTLRGCVIVAANKEVLLKAMPAGIVGSGASEEACLRDLAGEFANMLLGSVKGKLLADGIALQLACPITAIGSAMSLPSPSGGTSTWHAFTSASGTLHIRFDAQFDPDFDLVATPGEQESALAAGAGVLF